MEGVFFFVVFGTSKDKDAFSIAILNVEHFSHTPIHLSHTLDSISSSYIRCGFEVCDYIILHKMWEYIKYLYIHIFVCSKCDIWPYTRKLGGGPHIYAAELTTLIYILL
jgi:hypothetical protein